MKTCENCGAKSNFPGQCPQCGFEPAKARHNRKGDIKLYFCPHKDCGCFYGNESGSCPTHGPEPDEKSDPDKTPTDAYYMRITF